MVAFAANSILNRLALLDGAIGPGEFAAIRVASGLFVLVFLLLWRDRAVPKWRTPDLRAVAGLSIYMLGFSFAYVSMDAGLGALILFGGVQITMFAGALIEGDKPSRQRWFGMGIAMAGLAILTTPTGPVALSAQAILLMAAAAFGWGIYSLAGRHAKDPILATGWNFFYCLPIVLLALIILVRDPVISTGGILLAMLSGGVTSALGYALWYALLPRLGAVRGALTQLSAPAIALGLGALLLGETITMVAMIAAAMILSGIAIGFLPSKR